MPSETTDGRHDEAGYHHKNSGVTPGKPLAKRQTRQHRQHHGAGHHHQTQSQRALQRGTDVDRAQPFGQFAETSAATHHARERMNRPLGPENSESR